MLTVIEIEIKDIKLKFLHLRKTPPIIIISTIIHRIQKSPYIMWTWSSHIKINTSEMFSDQLEYTAPTILRRALIDYVTAAITWSGFTVSLLHK